MPADAAVQFLTESAHAAEPYLTNTHTHTTIKLMPADAAHAVQFPAESAVVAEPQMQGPSTSGHSFKVMPKLLGLLSTVIGVHTVLANPI